MMAGVWSRYRRAVGVGLLGALVFWFVGGFVAMAGHSPLVFGGGLVVGLVVSAVAGWIL